MSGCGLFGGDGGGDQKSPSAAASSSAPPSQSVEPGKLPPPVQTKAWNRSTADSEYNLLTRRVLVSVYGVYREGEHATLLASVQLDPAENDPNETGYALTSGFQRANLKPQDVNEGSSPAENADDVTLVDPTAKKAYLPARDAEGTCICGHDIIAVGHDKTSFTTTFAAPPSESTKIDVSMPNIGYFRDVPVFDQKAPEIEETTEGSVRVLVADQASTNPPAKAEVVDITGEVSNIDLSVVRSKDKVTLDANVLFEFDEATLTSKAKSRIAEAAEILKERAKGQRVEVRGYTDSKGSTSYNKRLSERRANAVKKALEPRLSGSGIKLVAKGYGEADPVAPNKTEDGKDNPKGRKLNRRVEVVYAK